MSEGFEYEIRKTEVYTLPFPDNQKLEQGINSFTQFDWIVSDKHLVTATVHVAPQRLGHVNMDYFNPLPTTPDASTHSYTGTVADRLTLFGGLLESTFSAMRSDVGVWAEGDQDLTITPMGNRGSYFANKTRDASRYSGGSSYSFASLSGWGAHNLKIGSYFAGSSENGQLDEHPVDILGPMQQWIERIDFPRSHSFQISDIEYSFYGQDHWVVSPRLALDLGVRTDSQEVSEAFRVAPRAGIAWSPFAHAGTLVQAGYGLFFDRVPLNVYCFNKYPDQDITMYGADGQVSAGPFLYLNTLGQVKVKHPFVFQSPQDGNFSPESAIWSLQVEQPLTPFLKLRVGYLQNYSQGLVILNSVAPDPDTNTGAYLLSGVGQSRYRQLEVTARMRLKGQGRQLFFSYVHSRARGDLNDFSNYLGTFPIPIIRGNQFGNLPADLPNRLLAWGMVQLPWKFRIAPVVEYRNGFPYFATDAAQELRRSSQPVPVPQLLLAGFPHFEGHPGQSEIRGSIVGEQLQPDQPLQPGGLPLKRRRPGVRLLLRPSRASFHGRFRRPVLESPCRSLRGCATSSDVLRFSTVDGAALAEFGVRCPKKMNFWPEGDNLWRSFSVFTVEATPQL